jgi:hypothetical protein
MTDYLKIHKDRVNDDLEERLYRFSFGICMGMNYLATKKVCVFNKTNTCVEECTCHVFVIVGFYPDYLISQISI